MEAAIHLQRGEFDFDSSTFSNMPIYLMLVVCIQRIFDCGWKDPKEFPLEGRNLEQKPHLVNWATLLHF